MCVIAFLRVAAHACTGTVFCLGKLKLHGKVSRLLCIKKKFSLYYIHTILTVAAFIIAYSSACVLGLSSSFYCGWTRLYQQKYNKFNQNITFISVVYIFCAVGCFSVRSNSSTSILAQRPVDVPTTKTRHCEESPEATNNWKASCEYRINVPDFFTLEQNYVFIQNFIPRPPSLRKIIFFLPCHDVPLFLLAHLAHPFFLLTPSPRLYHFSFLFVYPDSSSSLYMGV